MPTPSRPDAAPKPTAACRTCGRAMAIAGHPADGCRPTLPPHLCPHRARCSDVAGTACPSCAAVLDVKPEVLAPPCVWCVDPAAHPEGAKGKGCPACRWRGTLPADVALLSELRAETAPLR